MLGIKSSLEQVEERLKSAKDEKTSLERMAHSLRNELNREKKTKTEFETKNTELQSENGVNNNNSSYTSRFPPSIILLMWSMECTEYFGLCDYLSPGLSLLAGG